MSTESSYMKLLPSLFNHEDNVFLEQLLKVFEKILTGIDDSITPEGRDFKSISEIIDTISIFFYPDTVPDKAPEFLDWLASWVGLVLKEDWSPERKKKVIKSIVPLYRLRGTKGGLEEFIKIYVSNPEVKIRELKGTFSVGHTRVGRDTKIGGGMIPYEFVVDILLTVLNREKRERRERNIRKVLDAEKPVHTHYELKITIPTMQIGKADGCRIGRNTLIGGTRTEA